MKNNIKRIAVTCLICIFAISLSILHISAAESGGNDPASYIWIGGVQLGNGQYLRSGDSVATSVTQTNNYAYYKDGVLTLKNYTYSGVGTYDADGYGYYDAINSASDLTIKLEGTNNLGLTQNQAGEFSYGVIVGGNLEISSTSKNASLTVKGVTGDALYAEGNLKIQNVTVSLSAKENGVQVFGDLTVTDSNLTVVSEKTGLMCSNFVQGGGVVDVTAGGVGINASQNITINSGKMESRTTGTEENENYVAIGAKVKKFNYDEETLQVIASNSYSGTPTEEFVATSISSYRYILVVAKTSAPKPSYYVVFDVNGLDIDIPKQSIVHGERVVKPEDPKVDAYQFAGWYKDVQCQEAWSFDNDVVTATTTLYAKWIEKTPDHVHEFGTTWSYDNDNHWLVCSCSEKSGVENHVYYDEGKCIVCDYRSPDFAYTNNEGNSIVIIIVVAAIVLVSGGVVAIIFIKKKKANAPATVTTGTTNPQTGNTNAGNKVTEKTDAQRAAEQRAAAQRAAAQRATKESTEQNKVQTTTREPIGQSQAPKSFREVSGYSGVQRTTGASVTQKEAPKADNVQPKQPEAFKPVQESDKQPEAPKPVQESDKQPEAPNPVQESDKQPEAPKPVQESDKQPEAPKPMQESETQTESPKATQESDQSDAAQEKSEESGV